MMNKFEQHAPTAVDNAFKLIELMTASNQPMSVMEISRALNISRTTAYALVAALMKHHCLERLETTKKYALGYRFYEIGTLYRYQFPFLNTAEKYMVPVFEKWNLRMNLWVIKEPAVAVILLSMDDSLIPEIPHGYVVHAHATASGKLLMANRPAEITTRWFKDLDFPAITQKTITEKNALKWELESIRSKGFSEEDGELTIGRACIAAPIRDISGDVIAAVSFAGDRDKIYDNYDALVEQICALGQSISTGLGYNPLRTARTQ